MLARTFLKEDFEDIQALLKEKSFDWQDLLSEEEYEVASVKKYFSEIAKNDARLVKGFRNCLFRKIFKDACRPEVYDCYLSTRRLRCP